jgi:hypothetical protein
VVPLLASRPVQVVAAYLSPNRPLIVSDLTACLIGGLPVLMAGDLNAKHTDWNSWLITVRAGSYVITLTGTPVLPMGRTLPPLSLTSKTLNLMSLILSLSRT